MWFNIFKKKEKNMPTTDTDNRTTKQLKRKLAEQNKTISNILVRISDLTDDISSLQSELRRFKSDVADDVRYLTERVDGQGGI